MDPADLEEFYKVLESIASSLEKLNQNISALLGIQSQIVARLDQKSPEDQGKLMISKYKGTCAVCHKPINQGDPIVYSKSKGARHQTCPT
jgi:hypothetical protein